MSAFELRSYLPGDEIAICELFQQSYGRQMPLEYWRWRYAENPHGSVWIELAWDGERLAAHYAVSPTRLQVGNEIFPAALSMTTMTHPNYRGRGLFPKLAERLYGRLERAGFCAIFGFPNTLSHRGFNTSLGWRDIYEVPSLILSLENAKASKLISNIQIFDSLDARFDRFGEHLRERGIQTIRNSETLDWRFLRCPINRYRIAALTDGGDLRGYAVVKSYESRSLDIVDIQATDSDSGGELLDWAASVAAIEHLPLVSTWVLPNNMLRLEAESRGFQASAPVTYFGARALMETPKSIDQWRNWNLLMAESDVY